MICGAFKTDRENLSVFREDTEKFDFFPHVPYFTCLWTLLGELGLRRSHSMWTIHLSLTYEVHAPNCQWIPQNVHRTGPIYNVAPFPSYVRTCLALLARTSTVYSVIEKLIQISFFFLRNLMARVDLSNLSIWILSFLTKLRVFTFCFKEVFLFFTSQLPWSLLLSKIGVIWKQTLWYHENHFDN